MKNLIATAFLTLMLITTAGAQQILGLTQHPKTIRLKKDLPATFDSLGIRKSLIVPYSHNLKFQSYTRDNHVLLTDQVTGAANLNAAVSDVATAARNPTVNAIGGAFTFPFRYRPQNNLYEPNFSLSGAVGINLAYAGDAEGSLSFLLGFGASSIMVNKNNSIDTSSAGATRAATTLSFTVLGQLNNIQLAVSIGMDNDFNNSVDKWVYQSKPWFALGLGFNIFTKNN